VFPVQVPPLRQRKEDIPVLLNHFIDKVAREYGRSVRFTPRALSDLTLYDWPGNVREMENLIERLVSGDGDRVDATFLALPEPEPFSPAPDRPRAPAPASARSRGHGRSEVPGTRRKTGAVRQLRSGHHPRQIGYRIKVRVDQAIDQGQAPR
jgi:Nif-specific regulatory protein